MIAGGARPEPKEPFRPSGRQIGGAIIAVLLLVFIVTNTDDAQVTLLVTDVTMPLWLVLAITALLGVVVGMGLGARRTKRKYMEV
ncbi:lipopolysaccharide assembly protein LapA domain-containing protein [Dermatobacter hominis]|uniref:lipopolysaccharide assembly protein LapA domain-containing protein n=1 Tax=Dermatobacter hominis TaxID=2884263 RepID=UPI001D113CCE|nr:lipopolysaccharide assembly protein LapA domain-containing protein [Dermatobacter hominis]UDY34820.1 lipopolysaccharide assembly protein LapA domain-containing protein [Dermatobacter hominis]